jgi:hypothetical protein
MKIENIPDSIDPKLDLEQVREECLDMVKNALTFPQAPLWFQFHF